MQDTQANTGIAEVVRPCVEGMCENDAAKPNAAQHGNACNVGHLEGGLEWESREGFNAIVAAPAKEPDLSPWPVLNAMPAVGDMATLQVEDIRPGMHCDDTLTQLRHDGGWQIVSQVYFLRTAG